jgi:hypothetical protein
MAIISDFDSEDPGSIPGAASFFLLVHVTNVARQLLFGYRIAQTNNFLLQVAQHHFTSSRAMSPSN